MSSANFDFMIDTELELLIEWLSISIFFFQWIVIIYGFIFLDKN